MKTILGLLISAFPLVLIHSAWASDQDVQKYLNEWTVKVQACAHAFDTGNPPCTAEDAQIAAKNIQDRVDSIAFLNGMKKGNVTSEATLKKFCAETKRSLSSELKSASAKPNFAQVKGLTWKDYWKSEHGARNYTRSRDDQDFAELRARMLLVARARLYVETCDRMLKRPMKDPPAESEGLPGTDGDAAHSDDSTGGAADPG